MRDREKIHVPYKELGKKYVWPMGARTPLGLGSLYRVPAAPKLAVLCCFPPACVGGKRRQARAGWPAELRSQPKPKGRSGGAIPLAPALGSPAGEATYCGSQRSRTLGSWSRW